MWGLKVSVALPAINFLEFEGVRGGRAPGSGKVFENFKKFVEKIPNILYFCIFPKIIFRKPLGIILRIGQKDKIWKFSENFEDYC